LRLELSRFFCINMKSLKNHLRLSALLEGISFLVLLGIAMPLKYLAGLPQPVTIIGWAHGLLFVWYIASVLMAKSEYNLSLKHTAIALAGSVAPFGTFYADNKLFKRL
jgi:integral membrane protein